MVIMMQKIYILVVHVCIFITFRCFLLFQLVSSWPVTYVAYLFVFTFQLWMMRKGRSGQITKLSIFIRLSNVYCQRKLQTSTLQKSVQNTFWVLHPALKGLAESRAIVREHLRIRIKPFYNKYIVLRYSLHILFTSGQTNRLITRASTLIRS